MAVSDDQDGGEQLGSTYFIRRRFGRNERRMERKQGNMELKNLSLSLSLPFRSAFLLKSSKRWDYIAGHKIFRRMNASERLIKNFLPLLRLQYSSGNGTTRAPEFFHPELIYQNVGIHYSGGNTSNFCSNYFYRVNLTGNRNASRYRSQYLTNSLVSAEANLNIPPTWKFIRLFRRDRWGNNTQHTRAHAVRRSNLELCIRDKNSLAV